MANSPNLTKMCKTIFSRNGYTITVNEETKEIEHQFTPAFDEVSKEVQIETFNDAVKAVKDYLETKKTNP